ncbi:hypothetical protein BFF94_025530 [Burkholderia catarinensis]|nr:hypothetical protein BFF94_025530 [Burkholderia catarinensis]
MRFAPVVNTAIRHPIICNPQAEIVFDLDHVSATYGRDAIDRVRVDQGDQRRHPVPSPSVEWKVPASHWRTAASAERSPIG